MEQIVYIVDDDEAARESLSALLSEAGFSNRIFTSAQEFLAVSKSLRPGCVVSDVRMPGMDGLALLQQLKRLQLPFFVVFMTGHGEIRTAVRAIKAGAIDFVEKPVDSDTMISAIRTAHRELTRLGDDTFAEVARARIATLTGREKDVFERIVAGMPNRTIAQQLGLSIRTVEYYRSRVMVKTQAQSLSALVRLGLAAGLDLEL